MHQRLPLLARVIEHIFCNQSQPKEHLIVSVKDIVEDHSCG